ncbi:MAG: hypothetical protein EBT92_07555 [Planctomycetes bacterium]|nr:hypothetical protein [Planctomycetota bacterium]
MRLIIFKKIEVFLFVGVILPWLAELNAFDVQAPDSSFFKTKLSRVSSVVDLAFSNSVTKLDLLLEWNNKVEPVLINTVPYELECKYEGKTLAPIVTKGKSFAPVEEASSLPFVINLPYLKRNQAETFSIQGKIKAILPVSFNLVELGDLSKLIAEGVKVQPLQLNKGFSCSLKKIIAGATRISFGIQMEIDAKGPEFDTSQNWAVLNQLKLVNKKNSKDCPADGYIVEMMENRTANITYHFLLKDKSLGDFSDWRLVYKAVTGMKYQDIPFQFDSVPIP